MCVNELFALHVNYTKWIDVWYIYRTKTGCGDKEWEQCHNLQTKIETTPAAEFSGLISEMVSCIVCPPPNTLT